MRFTTRFWVLALLASSVVPVHAVEFNKFFGVDAIDMETELNYANGSETYDYSTVRLRYGIESEEGGSAGIEFIPAVTDDTIDPFGSEFELEVGPTLGVYFTVGKPVYLRLGLSVAEAKYTDVAFDVTDEDTMVALDWGLGFNVSPSRQLTVYGEYMVRDAGDVEFDSFFFGEVDHDSEIFSLGVNYMF